MGDVNAMILTILSRENHRFPVDAGVGWESLLLPIVLGILRVILCLLATPKYTRILRRMKTSCQGWCGLCYANRRGRANYPGHVGFVRPVRKVGASLESYLQRRESTSTNADGSYWCAPDVGDRKSHPALCEFIAAAVFGDGQPRKAGTLTIFSEDQKVKGCLNDREQGLTLFLAADSLAGLLAAAEKALRSDRADWRQSRWGSGGKKGK
jgi:hypothetical protein